MLSLNTGTKTGGYSWLNFSGKRMYSSKNETSTELTSSLYPKSYDYHESEIINNFNNFDSEIKINCISNLLYFITSRFNNERILEQRYIKNVVNKIINSGKYNYINLNKIVIDEYNKQKIDKEIKSFFKTFIENIRETDEITEINKQHLFDIIKNQIERKNSKETCIKNQLKKSKIQKLSVTFKSLNINDKKSVLQQIICTLYGTDMKVNNCKLNGSSSDIKVEDLSNQQETENDIDCTFETLMQQNDVELIKINDILSKQIENSQELQQQNQQQLEQDQQQLQQQIQDLTRQKEQLQQQVQELNNQNERIRTAHLNAVNETNLLRFQLTEAQNVIINNQNNQIIEEDQEEEINENEMNQVVDEIIQQQDQDQNVQNNLNHVDMLQQQRQREQDQVQVQG